MLGKSKSIKQMIKGPEGSQADFKYYFFKRNGSPEKEKQENLKKSSSVVKFSKKNNSHMKMPSLKEYSFKKSKNENEKKDTLKGKKNA